MNRDSCDSCMPWRWKWPYEFYHRTSIDERWKKKELVRQMKNSQNHRTNSTFHEKSNGKFLLVQDCVQNRSTTIVLMVLFSFCSCDGRCLSRCLPLYHTHFIVQHQFFSAFDYFLLSVPLTFYSNVNQLFEENTHTHTHTSNKSLSKLMIFLWLLLRLMLCSRYSVFGLIQNTVTLNFCSMNCNFYVYRHMYYTCSLSEVGCANVNLFVRVLYVLLLPLFIRWCCCCCCCFFTWFVRFLVEIHFESHHLEIQCRDKWFV